MPSDPMTPAQVVEVLNDAADADTVFGAATARQGYHELAHGWYVKSARLRAAASVVEAMEDKAQAYRETLAAYDTALRAVRAFEALASGRVTVMVYAESLGLWFIYRDNSMDVPLARAPDPLDAITQALEATDD